MLRSRRTFDLGYQSDCVGDVATRKIDDNLIILRGPRRVDKSVLLKDMIATFCGRDDVSPRQVIYLPTDRMRANDLNRAAKLSRGCVVVHDSDTATAFDMPAAAIGGRSVTFALPPATIASALISLVIVRGTAAWCSGTRLERMDRDEKRT